MHLNRSSFAKEPFRYTHVLQSIPTRHFIPRLLRKKITFPVEYYTNIMLVKLERFW